MHKLILKFKNVFRAINLYVNDRLVKSREEVEVDMFLEVNKSKISSLTQIAKLSKTEEFKDILDLIWVAIKIKDGDFEGYSKRLRNFLKIMNSKLEKRQVENSKKS